MSRLTSFLREEIDNSQLILFRILFGLLIAIECGGAILTGWVRRVFIEPDFTFPYIGFEWLQPLPGSGMYFYYAVMAVLGLMVAFGVRYRFAMVAWTVLWTASFLMQKTSYNNHYYLLALLGILMSIVPANRAYARDVMRDPSMTRATCPRWCTLIFITQIAIVYFYGGVAKLQPDWIAGKPMKLFLAAKEGTPVLGALYAQPFMVPLMSWGGILFDLLIIPMLLWRRTRWLALGLAVVFHLFNSITFHVGVFPFLALSFSIFFFPAADIRRTFFRSSAPADTRAPGTSRMRPAVALFLVVFFLLQLCLPLRHWLIPGDVNWTEEGHRFSWRMMLRGKQGSAEFLVRDRASRDEWTVRPRQYLTRKQAGRLAVRPDMIWQFSRFLVAEYAKEGLDVETYARSRVSLNGAPVHPLVDPSVDLASVEWRYFSHATWITSRGPRR